MVHSTVAMGSLNLHFMVKAKLLYTLSHPENDRDITGRVQEYTLQDA